MTNLRAYTLCSVFVLCFFVLGFTVYNPTNHSELSIQSNSSQATGSISKADPMALLPELAESMGKDSPAYHIYDTGDGVFKAQTPSSETTAEFKASSVTVSHKDIGTISMSLSGSDQVTPLKTSESRVQYDRGAVTEWYINSPLGLEQGFTVNTRPQTSNGDTLELALDLETSEGLQITQAQDGKSIKFVNTENQTQLRYGKLSAFDSNGVELVSSLRLTDNGIVLAVKDSDAVYPVMIDPLFETQKITANDASNKDNFGRSVDIDGEYAVVGAPDDNISLCDKEPLLCEMSDDGRDQGSAYVFKRMGPADWQQVAKLTADDGYSYDYFGYSVAISGNLIIVGSPYDNIHVCENDPIICTKDFEGNKDQGSAYLFKKNGQGNWNQLSKLLASDGSSYDHFGKSVDIHGTIAVVGSPDDNIEVICPSGDDICTDGKDEYDGYRDQGSAYIFESVTPPTTFETQKIVANDGYKYDRFGSAVGVYGQTIVVGAPDDNIHVCELEPIYCETSFKGNKDQGSAYVFEKGLLKSAGPYSLWIQVAKLLASDGYSYDHFGASVAIFQSTIIVGSPDDNVHYCEDPGDDNMNTSDEPVVCDEGFESDGKKGDFEGHKDQGSAYVFERMYIWPPYENQKLIAYDGYKYDHYGFSVSIYDGKALIGSPYDNIHVCENDPLICEASFEGNRDQGSAYLYEFVPDWGYEFLNKLLASDGYSYDRFGKDVSLTGSFAISGAPDANLLMIDPDKICGSEVTGEDEVENTDEITEEITDEEEGELTAQDYCGPKDQGAAYIYDIGMILEGLTPGIENELNACNGNNATPGGQVVIVFGYQLGNTILYSGPCPGLALGINPWDILGVGTANPDGTYSFPVFVPPFENIPYIYIQAVDLVTCTASGVVYQPISVH